MGMQWPPRPGPGRRPEAERLRLRRLEHLPGVNIALVNELKVV